MLSAHDPARPKRPANLSVNSDLLREAKKFNINLSATLEAALIEVLRSKRQEQWLHENRHAIAAYNAHVEENGVFSDGLRSF